MLAFETSDTDFRTNSRSSFIWIKKISKKIEFSKVILKSHKKEGIHLLNEYIIKDHFFYILFIDAAGQTKRKQNQPYIQNFSILFGSTETNVSYIITRMSIRQHLGSNLLRSRLKILKPLAALDPRYRFNCLLLSGRQTIRISIPES